MNIRVVASAQSDAIAKKAAYWRGYIDVLAKEAAADRQFLSLRAAGLWASTFAHIEWLTAFYLCRKSVSKEDVATVLKDCWGWDGEVGKLFWKSGRNPIAHVGQANPFHSYYMLNALPTNVSLDTNHWTKAVTKDWDNYNEFKAVSVLPPLDMGDGEFQNVTFFHQMLRDDLLPVLAERVCEKTAAERDQAILDKLLRLNAQIPH